MNEKTKPWDNANLEKSIKEYRELANVKSFIESQLLDVNDRMKILRLEIVNLRTDSPLDYIP